MDDIQKFLKKVSKHDYDPIMHAVEKITLAHLEGLNIKKLKGFEDVYRVRVGKYRIIFERSGKTYKIVKISNRDDTTYNL